MDRDIDTDIGIEEDADIGIARYIDTDVVIDVNIDIDIKWGPFRQEQEPHRDGLRKDYIWGI